jgi:hypothetical protein
MRVTGANVEAAFVNSLKSEAANNIEHRGNWCTFIHPERVAGDQEVLLK